MSRPQKIHPPIKGAFNNILAAVAAGNVKPVKKAKPMIKATQKKPNK